MALSRLAPLAALLLAAGLPTASEAASPEAIAAADRLGRGINLGNALDAKVEGDWGAPLTEEDFEKVAAAGFDSIRLPVRWSSRALAEPPYTIDRAFFDRVDWAIAQAVINGLAVVLNVHHYDELMSDPNGHEERFAALWRQVASHYASAPNIVVFEVLNEPHKQLRGEAWNRVQASGLAAIRESNPDRPVVIGPFYNSMEALDDYEVPDDPALILSYHTYKPLEFTHQGAPWVEGAMGWLGTQWDGSFAGRAKLVELFDTADEFARAHDLPVYVGEFGSIAKADMDSRIRWATFMRKEFERRGWSWAYWDLRSTFGAIERDTGRWSGILQALIPEAESG